MLNKKILKIWRRKYHAFFLVYLLFMWCSEIFWTIEKIFTNWAGWVETIWWLVGETIWLFLVKDMQVFPPSPPQKEPFSFFVPNSWEMFWNKWKKNPIYFFQLWSILLTIFKWFSDFILTASHKMCNVLNRIFFIHEFFFVRFLVFELWSILCFTFVAGLRKNWKKNRWKASPPITPIGATPLDPI